MRFTSFFAIGASALTLLSALPTTCGAAIDGDIVKRDSASDAVSILNDATSQITPLKVELLAKFDAQVDLATALASEDFLSNDILPLIQQITSIVGDAASKITALGSSFSKTKRQVDVTAVAIALATLVKEVVAALQPLLSFLSSIALIQTLLGGTLATLGANLNTIAVGLGLVVGGVLEVVQTLLADLTGALSGLGFVDLLTTLGLL